MVKAEFITLSFGQNTKQNRKPLVSKHSESEGFSSFIMVKKHNNLWEKLISKENFLAAFYKAKKKKSRYIAVQEFEKDLDKNIEIVRKAVANKTFTTAHYKQKNYIRAKRKNYLYLTVLPR